MKYQGLRVKRVSFSLGMLFAIHLIVTAVLFAVPRLADAAFYTTDFNAGAPPEFSGITTTEGVQGYVGTGSGSNTFQGDFFFKEYDWRYVWWRRCAF